MKNLISALVGMGVGMLAGVCIYRFATSEQGHKMRSELAHAIRDSGKCLDTLMDSAREKGTQMSAKVDEKVRDAARKVEAM